MVKIKNLENGLKIVYEKIDHVRSVALGIWVVNGSKNEAPEVNGVSHFIEHMIFKGTQKRTAKDIAEEMDKIGGNVNAFTTKEYTCYHTRVLDKNFNTALDIISDMFLNSKFDDKEIEKEKNVIIEEINMYEDSPEDLVHEAMQGNVWQDNPLGRPILGTEETISKFNSETLKDYFKHNYQPENTLISICGNIEEDEMLLNVEKYFANWSSSCDFNPLKEESVYKKSNAKISKDIEQVHLCITFEGLKRNDDERYIMNVFNTIFGGGMSSKLFQKIREENGLTYSVYSYPSSYKETGVFTIYAALNPNQIKKVVELILKEIDDFKKSDVSLDLLNKTKEQILSGYIMSTESTASRMSNMGVSMLVRDYVMTEEEVIEKFENVTAKDVSKMANKIFNMDTMSIFVVGAVSDIDIDELLKQ